jgi:nicotinamide mononucleotide transporter
VSNLAHTPNLSRASRNRDLLLGVAASALLIAGSTTGTLSFSITETLGFVTGAAAVWLLVRESIWTWPAGIANGVFYLVLFAQARFFADSALQVVYIVLGFFGWWWWLRGRRGQASSRPITTIGPLEAASLAALTAAASFGMLLYLRSVDDSAPLADAVTTALSLAATWMQARKQLENWLVWLAADAIYIPLYFVKGLPLTGVLYCVFALMCVKGWFDWSRTRRTQPARRRPRAAGIGKPDVKRVVLLGAESTGKTTLARSLADHYATVWNPELGHAYSWYRPEDATDWQSWRTGEFVEIAALQNWYEDFLAQLADRVLFCDTNAWTTGLFHEVYLGERSPEVDAYANRAYDLYLLCDPDTPFAQDELGMRTDGPHRRRMHEAYLEHVRMSGTPYVVVSGTHAERMAAATAAVDALLGVTRPPRRRPVRARLAGSARSRAQTPASRC